MTPCRRRPGCRTSSSTARSPSATVSTPAPERAGCCGPADEGRGETPPAPTVRRFAAQSLPGDARHGPPPAASPGGASRPCGLFDLNHPQSVAWRRLLLIAPRAVADQGGKLLDRALVRLERDLDDRGARLEGADPGAGGGGHQHHVGRV